MRQRLVTFAPGFAPTRQALLIGVSVCLAGCSAAWAQPQAAKPEPARVGAPAGLSWTSLSAEQRRVLAPLAREWASLDDDRRSKWLEVAARYPKLSADEKQRLQQRMSDWARMSPAQRGQARLTFQENKQLTEAEKRARWEAYNSLTDGHRQAIVEYSQSAPTQPRTARPQALLKPVSPTVVQTGPGAATALVNKTATSALPAQPAASRGGIKPGDQLDRATLLPKRLPEPAPKPDNPSQPAPAAAPTPAPTPVPPPAPNSAPAEASPSSAAPPTAPASQP